MFLLKNIYKLLPFVLLFLAIACSSDDGVGAYTPVPNPNPEEELKLTPLELDVPAYFPKTTFKDVTLTEEGFNLGKRLFKDPRLSTNGSSCQTCHGQEFAFTHHGHPLSSVHDVTDPAAVLGTRNSQPLMNLAFLNEFAWEGRIETIQEQPKGPLERVDEMNTTEEAVLKFLRENTGQDSYPELFAKAFQKQEGETDVINPRTLYSAFSQYMLGLVSANTKYDQVRQGTATYTEVEQRGYTTFKNKCASCHAEPLFTDQSYRNNGLLATMDIPDELGRAAVTDLAAGKNSADYYKFRVPSLRNIRYTFPYMHDGRLGTIGGTAISDSSIRFKLMDVLNYYDTDKVSRSRTSVADAPNLDPSLKNGTTLGIDLSENEKNDLIDFLLTLNDLSFVENSDL